MIIELGGWLLYSTYGHAKHSPRLKSTLKNAIITKTFAAVFDILALMLLADILRAYPAGCGV